jgi:hypothetical protein
MCDVNAERTAELSGLAHRDIDAGFVCGFLVIYFRGEHREHDTSVDQNSTTFAPKECQMQFLGIHVFVVKFLVAFDVYLHVLCTTCTK